MVAKTAHVVGTARLAGQLCFPTSREQQALSLPSEEMGPKLGSRPMQCPLSAQTSQPRTAARPLMGPSKCINLLLPRSLWSLCLW